jgi:hypothetical protein
MGVEHQVRRLAVIREHPVEVEVEEHRGRRHEVEDPEIRWWDGFKRSIQLPLEESLQCRFVNPWHQEILPIGCALPGSPQ